MNLLNDVLEGRTNTRNKPTANTIKYGYSATKITPVSSIKEDVKKDYGSFKYENMARKRFDNTRLVWVNNTQYTVNGELVLPETITSLIGNKAYIPRYKKLARLYGVDYLIKLAEIARTKGKKREYFGACCSIKNWETRTLEVLNELFRKIHELKEQLQGIEVSPKYFFYLLRAKGKLAEGRFNRLLELAKKRWVDRSGAYLVAGVQEAYLKNYW